jgi:predicted nucleic acid-binding protein
VLAYSDDSRDPAKNIRAVEVVKEQFQRGSGVVSLQVLQEYYTSAVSKLGLPAERARFRVTIFSNFQVVEPKLADVLAAIDLHRLYNLSYWDALILRCAKQSGCTVLLTEDMQNGQTIDGVRIVNPFL